MELNPRDVSFIKLLLLLVGNNENTDEFAPRARELFERYFEEEPAERESGVPYL